MRISIRACCLAACCLAFGAWPASAQPLQSEPAGDEAVADPVAVTEASPPPPANLLEARIAIERLLEAGDFAAAAALGDVLLEHAAREFGENSSSVADAHLLLADAYKRDGDFGAAEGEILSAITIFASTDGPVSPALIEPYLALGDNYSAGGDHQNAISAYSEARTIGRRNFGLLNEDQLTIIDVMTEAAEELGQTEEARELQLDALTLIERVYGEYSVEAIEATYKYAAWLRAHSYYEDERRLYYQIMRVVEQQHGSDPLMTVRALRERAASFRQADLNDGLGSSGLREAQEILEAMPDPPKRLLAEVLLEIGDWYVEFGRTSSIGSAYLEAWRLLGEVDGGEELRKQWFDELVEIEISVLSSRGLSTESDAPQGYVVVYFTVDVAGRAREIEITDSQPRGLKDSAVRQLMREARFRPGIIDGVLIPTRRAYRFEFRYEARSENENAG